MLQRRCQDSSVRPLELFLLLPFNSSSQAGAGQFICLNSTDSGNVCFLFQLRGIQQLNIGQKGFFFFFSSLSVFLGHPKSKKTVKIVKQTRRNDLLGWSSSFFHHRNFLAKHSENV